MAIPDVERNSLAMELLKNRIIGIVDEHKLPSLVLVNTSPKIKDKSTIVLTSGRKRMKKAYPSNKR